MNKLGLAAVSLCTISVTAHADVRDTDRERVFALPSVRPALALPTGDWTIQREQRREGDTAVYYHLASEKTHLNFSVYIDKTMVCTKAEACLEAALKNKTYQAAQEMLKSSVGAFEVATFYLDKPSGLPIQQAHVLAAAYVDGVWFDVHISLAANARPELGPLLDVLKSVELR